MSTTADSISVSGLTSLHFAAVKIGAHDANCESATKTRGEPQPRHLARIAAKGGLRARRRRLNWTALCKLKSRLPLIVRAKLGPYLVLSRIDEDASRERVFLIDAATDRDLLLPVDRDRFEALWTGDVIVARRRVNLTSQDQPFSPSLIAAIALRERSLGHQLINR